MVVSNKRKNQWYKKYRATPAGVIAQRKSRLKRYGITPEEYAELLKIQNNACGICKKPETIPNRNLAVDHDKQTGRIRGLLCYKCNTGIGKLGDTLEGVRRAVRYLEGY